MGLKPCPFCGGEIRIVRLHGGYGEPWYARCDRCEVSGYYYSTEAQAIEAWSDRPERTCEVEGYDDGVDEGMDGEWYTYGPPTWHLSCGHETYGSTRPCYCSTCGARVVSADGED